MEETISEDRFKCQICLKTFRIKTNLERHERIHTREKPFRCNICYKTFTDKGGLVIHKKRMHFGVKPFQCDICEKKFPRKIELDQHKRIHTGEKPYDCDICGKKFSHSSSLKYHVKIHSKTHSVVKKFTCDVCGIQVAEKDKSSINLKIHKGDEKYVCSVCEGMFTLSQILDIFESNNKRNLQNDSNCEMINKTEKEEHKLGDISKEDNAMIELPTQGTDNQISDGIKSETLASHENPRKQEMSVTSSYTPYLCVHCWKSFSIESDFINHKTTCHGKESSLQNQITEPASEIQFVDCRETIKQEIKEEEIEMEDEFNPLDFMSSEFCEDVGEGGETSLKSEFKTESIDCEETVKLEIKQETHDGENLPDPTIIQYVQEDLKDY